MVSKNAVSFCASPSYLKCTWPIFSVFSIVALKPPRVDQNLAALLAAAITELSSMAMGMV